MINNLSLSTTLVDDHLDELDGELKRASIETRWDDLTINQGLAAGQLAVKGLRAVLAALDELEYEAGLTIYTALLQGLDGPR